ncbi:MAG TPA: glycosyltransferase [Synechococcales cyanobacterium M55_K2018_004]|nr:glycosyltransferase [Synechococcales cyanobacterium M55_K2018_004]
MKELSRFHLGFLLGCAMVGSILRLGGLATKPLWTDEFATIVFSLGNSFRTIPLDRVIALPELLQPLQPNPQAGFTDVVQNLLRESNHPPLYFLLTHLWLQVFPTSGGYVSELAARSLPAIFGVLSIPATFWLAWVVFRNLTIAQVAAAFTALSPFGIYLAQEARHYTLSVLWVIASLGCLAIAVHHVRYYRPLPWGISLAWIVVNALGIATHYFFLLTLAAAGIALLCCLLCCLGISCLGISPRLSSCLPSAFPTWSSVPTVVWQRLLIVAGGTVASALVWLPWIIQTQDTELTRWITHTGRSGVEWLAPIGNLLASGITMLYLLPIQAPNRTVAIASIVGLLLITLATLPLLWRGFRQRRQPPHDPMGLGLLSSFLIGAIALFLGMTYFVSTDLTSAFRYSFVYFPAVLVLLASCLTPPASASPPRQVLLIGILSLVGALTVVTNLSYQKTHRPDLVVQAIQQQSQAPALVASVHRTHGQTGRLMGIAWEWHRRQESSLPPPHFLLAHQGPNSDAALGVLERAIAAQPRPFDLWLVEFRSVNQEMLAGMLKQQQCRLAAPRRRVDGYRWEGYACRR